MGLAERRAAKEFETKRFPELKKEIQRAAQFDLPLEVKWESLVTEGESHLYDELWPKVYFQPLRQALEQIAIDDMGRDALKAGLKKVIIQNVSGSYSPASHATFEGGVLTIDHLPTTNADDVRDRAQALQKLLEEKL